jgi:hypothetical protein
MAIFILATKVKEVVDHQVDVPALDELQIEVPPSDTDEPAQPSSPSSPPESNSGRPDTTEEL